MKQNSFLKKISYTFLANLVSFSVSAISTLILSKFMGVEEYGYYQYYILLASYSFVFCLGWLDGIYLKYAGTDYDKLDKSNLRFQWFLFIALQVVLAIVVVILGVKWQDTNKTAIFVLWGLSNLVYLCRAFLHNILQVVERFREYSLGFVIEKGIFVLVALVLIIIGKISFEYFIYADIIGKVCALFYVLVCSREILFAKGKVIAFSLKEIADNIKVGLNLTISNFSSMMITGIQRLGIEKYWSIEVFGRVSLTLSMSNMLMTFIRAVALVLFPTLKKAKDLRQKDIYIDLRTILITILLGMLLVYYPFSELLGMWLPNYRESIRYMAILFPICFFESKTALLTEVYLKAMREERKILVSNVASLLISVFLLFISMVLLHNLELTLVGIVCTLAIRNLIGEFWLMKKLDINLWKENLIENILIILFISCSYIIQNIMGAFIYVCVLAVYIGWKKEDIVSAGSKLIELIKKRKKKRE